MSKSSIAEIIAEISATRQVIPTERLMKWLENNGFHARTNTGGSHIFVTHEAHRDIYTTLIRNTAKISTQRTVRGMLQKLAQREESIACDFNESALSASFIADTLEQKIPADLQYRLTESGNIVLTDRAYPQVGLTFTQENVRLAENKVRELTAIKREYAVMLYRMTNEHDVAPPHMDNGVYNGHLHHLVYDHMPEETLSLYQEHDGSANALEQLNAYIEKIQNIDLEHACRKEDALSNPVIRQTLVTSASRRGERHNHIYYDGANGKTLKFTFNSFSNQRTTYSGMTARISLSELEKLERIVSGITSGAERRLMAA